MCVTDRHKRAEAHLVAQHRVKLVEDVLAEAGSMDGDSSSTPTDVTRGHICHYSSTVATAWEGGDVEGE